MPAVIEQQNSGTTAATTPATFNATLPVGTTTGRQLVIIVSADATVATPAGFTLDRSQVNNNGHYVFRKATASGETSWTFTPSASASAAWWAGEISGLTSTPLDVTISAGTASAVSSQSTGTTATTTQANALAIASVGTSNGVNAVIVTQSGWTNSFVEQADVFTTKAAPTNVGVGVATKALSATGTQTSTATLSEPVAATGIMVVYKESGAAAPLPPQFRRSNAAVMRAATH